jgi:Skp family chaperone for outer membrane proteins
MPFSLLKPRTENNMHKNRLMIGAAAMLLAAMPVALHAQTAAVPPAPAAPAAPAIAAPAKAVPQKPKTRLEAIQMMETRLAALKKMTDAEWAKKQAARASRKGERMGKFKSMTPEKRAAMREKLKAKP